MTGKTVDEALRKAKEELGVTTEDTGFEILEMPRRSFFGLRNSPAKVRVYLLEEESPLPAKKTESKAGPEEKERRSAPAQPEHRPRPEPQRSRREKPEAPKPEPKAEPRAESKMDPKAELKTGTKAEPKAEPRENRKPSQPRKPAAAGAKEPSSSKGREPAAPPKERTFTPEDQLSTKAKMAIEYVTDILKAMGVQEAVVRACETADSIDLYLEGTGLGVIIGRRGETLDAVQYLTSLVANRIDGDYVRISIDSGDYRQKRAETLERLAQKLARNAVKSGRSTRLEPMNPYERRIIHAAVSKVEGAASSSIGEEPNRRVVISPKNARKKQEGDAAHREPSHSRGKSRDGARDAGRRGDRSRSDRPERFERPARTAPPENLEKINDGDIEIPQDLAPKPLKAPQPVQKAESEPHTPTAEEKDVLPLYGKIEL
jgi:spoIIIJ-associated protein